MISDLVSSIHQPPKMSSPQQLLQSFLSIDHSVEKKEYITLTHKKLVS
ncbi:hypothetical protein VRK_02640 [Vibrio sp. MEBiC08052]|nr:hypothetical protein VRK_02640 [Vibrio sp. MEBiC08052]